MNFFITCPHSGEEIPDFVTWLDNLPEKIIMADVDRYVDQLYTPAVSDLQIHFITSQWHRYVADLNRHPTDVDQNSVSMSENPKGTHKNGLHWVVTKNNEPLMEQPISLAEHKKILDLCYHPFHQSVQKHYQKLFQDYDKVYQLDVHSMPSLGTKNHRDPGEQRAEVVISDQDGKSCSQAYRDLVVTSYEQAGFQVKLNWPYKGGGITQKYGQPELGQHCIQVELNRALYMDETTKKIQQNLFDETQDKINVAVRTILYSIKQS